MLQDDKGNILSNESAQRMIAKTFERCGRFIISSRVAPTVGEVQEFAGLPMRVVRFVSYEEALKDDEQNIDIWQGFSLAGDFYFEVEVAD